MKIRDKEKKKVETEREREVKEKKLEDYKLERGGKRERGSIN